MANRKVGLYLYTNSKRGWRYLPAVFRGKKIDPHVGGRFREGKVVQEYHPTATYYLGYRQDGRKVWEKLTPDPQAAVKALERKRAELAVVATGGTIVPEISKHSLADAIEDWLEMVKEKLSLDSHGVKKLVLEEFVASTNHRLQYVEDITRLDGLRYINSYLEGRGNDPRTRFNKYGHLRAFLRDHNHDIFKNGDGPKYAERDVEVYSDDEIQRFFKVCDSRENLLFSVYYWAGLRMQECQSLRWVDVNLTEKNIKIQPRPEYGFTPKKWHCRTIPINQELANRLAKFKASAEGPLVFPTSGTSGKGIDHHHLDWCKRIGRYAHIISRCFLHKWRASFCTLLVRQQWDLGSVMLVMGHKNLESTARYVASLKQAGLRDKMDVTTFQKATG